MLIGVPYKCKIFSFFFLFFSSWLPSFYFKRNCFTGLEERRRKKKTYRVPEEHEERGDFKPIGKLYTIKLSSTCEEFKFRGWYDAAFRLGQAWKACAHN